MKSLLILSIAFTIYSAHANAAPIDDLKKYIGNYQTISWNGASLPDSYCGSISETTGDDLETAAQQPIKMIQFDLRKNGPSTAAYPQSQNSNSVLNLPTSIGSFMEASPGNWTSSFAGTLFDTDSINGLGNYVTSINLKIVDLGNDFVQVDINQSTQTDWDNSPTSYIGNYSFVLKRIKSCSSISPSVSNVPFQDLIGVYLLEKQNGGPPTQDGLCPTIELDANDFYENQSRTFLPSVHFNIYYKVEQYKDVVVFDSFHYRAFLTEGTYDSVAETYTSSDNYRDDITADAWSLDQNISISRIDAKTILFSGSSSSTNGAMNTFQLRRLDPSELATICGF